jgi:hypothetical protein
MPYTYVKVDEQSSNPSLARVQIEDGEITQSLKNTYPEVWQNTRSGTELYGWKKKIRRGLNATTSYNCTFREVTIPIADATMTRRWPGPAPFVVNWQARGSLASNWGDVPVPSNIAVINADRSARLQFMKKYRSMRTAMQGGVFLGELREAVKMIRNPAQALRRQIHDFTHVSSKKRGGFGSSARNTADAWLEASFGWMPLIEDIKDAAKVATRHPFRVFEDFDAEWRDYTSKDSFDGKFQYGGLEVKYRNCLDGFAHVKYQGAIKAETAPPGFPEQFGLSWSNVIPAAWELVPWSFLIDYFTNVGKVIDGMACGTIQLAWGCRTTWRVYERFIEAVAIDWDSINPSLKKYYTGNASGGGKSGSRSTYTRDSVNSVSVGIRDFQFRLPNSSTQFLNIAALAAGRTQDASRRSSYRR